MATFPSTFRHIEESRNRHGLIRTRFGLADHGVDTRHIRQNQDEELYREAFQILARQELIKRYPEVQEESDSKIYNGNWGLYLADHPEISAELESILQEIKTGVRFI